MDSVSVGDLNKVANEAWDRFCKGTGGTYTNATLTEKVRDHEKHKKFVNEFWGRLQKATLDKKCDLANFTPLLIGRYAFESTTDKAGDWASSSMTGGASRRN